MPNDVELFIERYHRPKFEKGEHWALLDAVDMCAHAGIPMPLWLAEAFSRCYGDWHRFGVKTLDEAFDVTRPKGIRLRDRARREMCKSRVIFEIVRRHKNGCAIDDELFAIVGKAVGNQRCYR